MFTINVYNCWNIEILNNNHLIITKPKRVFNQTVRYTFEFGSNQVIISGQVATSTIGATTDPGAALLNWEAIVKGNSHFGSPGFGTMVAFAESIRNGKIYYSKL